ncbi:hypothetical protein MMC28_006034 [Mycoblastus sanguinarius]|nr:hypothetical protein [Mycoblastus sanguinarius]
MQTPNRACGSFRFLHLPREIRDRIYEAVLDSEVHALSFPKTKDKIYRIKNEDWRRNHEAVLDSIVHAPSLPKTKDKFYRIKNENWRRNHVERDSQIASCLGLLACNRQISSEMRESISRKNTSSETGVQYKLDLISWGDTLNPTWLSLPTPPGYVKSLDVQFRVLRHKNSHRVSAMTMLEMLHLFRQLFRHGPLFRPHPCRNNGEPRYPFHINMITINFVEVPKRSSFGIDDASGQRHPLWFMRGYLTLMAHDGIPFDELGLLRLRYGDLIEEFTFAQTMC